MKKKRVAEFLSRSGLRAVLGRLFSWSGVLVLNYHRIGNGSTSPFDRGLWSASADAFADQLRFFKSQLDLITPRDLPRAVAAGRGRYGLITFDDGYRDSYEAAFPILKSENVSATFFISTGFIDEPRVPWWDEIAWMVRKSQRSSIDVPGWLPNTVPFDEPDRESAVRTLLRAYKAMPSESTDRYMQAIANATGSTRCSTEQGRGLWMDWDMLREMRAGGMTIGGHTGSHTILARATRERQRNEITGCGKRLVEELGEPMRCFSYPVGGREAFDDTTRELLREAGVEYAFSYYGGYRKFGDWDDYDVRRVAIESDLTPGWFRSIVSLPALFG